MGREDTDGEAGKMVTSVMPGKTLAPLPWGGACALLELEALVDGQLAVMCKRTVSER